MKTLYLSREDIRTDVHPFFWYELLEELLDEDALPESRNDYPESIRVRVASAEVD